MLRSPLRAYKTGADTNDRLGRHPTNRKTSVDGAIPSKELALAWASVRECHPTTARRRAPGPVFWSAPESAGIQRRPGVLADKTLSELPGGVGASQQRQMPVPVVHAENPWSREVDVGLRDVESPAEASHGLDMLGQHGIG